MRVFVTGGAGFIGSHIVERLVASGHEVLVADDLSAGKRNNLPPDVRVAELDIGDPEMLDLASSFRPDVITHCAAQKSVTVSMADPEMDAQTNIMGGLNVCRAAMKSGCNQLIYISTGGALYGEPQYLPCDEDHPIRPMSPYGLSKWTLECYLRILLPESMALKVLRLANVYGPRQDPEGEAGVVAIFETRMVGGERVVIYGDGEQSRDFVYVGDVARAHELAQSASEPLTVNIGSGTATSVNDLFGRIAAETGYKLPPVYEDDRPGEIKHIVLDNSRAREILGWSPETDLSAGLRATLDWTRTRER